MENQKNFDLGTILTLTSGRLFTGMEELYDVLNYLTNETISTVQLPAIMEIVNPYVLSLYPQLKGVGADLVINNIGDVRKFVDEQKKIYGDSLPLSPIEKKYENDARQR